MLWLVVVQGGRQATKEKATPGLAAHPNHPPHPSLRPFPNCVSVNQGNQSINLPSPPPLSVLVVTSIIRHQSTPTTTTNALRSFNHSFSASLRLYIDFVHPHSFLLLELVSSTRFSSIATPVRHFIATASRLINEYRPSSHSIRSIDLTAILRRPAYRCSLVSLISRLIAIYPVFWRSRHCYRLLYNSY